MIRAAVSAIRFADAAVWKVTARQVVECVPARRYLAIVPDDEIARFRAVSPAAYEISGDSAWLGGLTRAAIAERLAEPFKYRAGWYLQQLVKIAAVAEGADDDVNLIWDGDTVPMRQLEFVSPNGKLRYYTGTENHTPYFQTIEALLGLSKASDFSFIAQCFPVRAGWVRQMIGAIEGRHRMGWREAIIAHVPSRNISEFSEYETLGQFSLQHHGGQMEFPGRPWSRDGYDYVSGPRAVTPALARVLARSHDFYAFEERDRWRGIAAAPARMLRRSKLLLQGLRS